MIQRIHSIFPKKNSARYFLHRLCHRIINRTDGFNRSRKTYTFHAVGGIGSAARMGKRILWDNM